MMRPMDDEGDRRDGWLWLSAAQVRVLGAAMDRVIPGDGLSPGAGTSGGASYVDGLLGAFSVEPPRIWAGGPFSGRHGGDGRFADFLEPGGWERLAWRTRIEGSRGDPQREHLGAVRGWQEIYADGFAVLGDDFADLDDDDRDARLAATDEEFRELLFTHGCEALYGDPVYGGNRDAAGWAGIDFEGDVQPRGYTDEQVSEGTP
jgi:Gluconate 2-dehydrogenase subunit 3